MKAVCKKLFSLMLVAILLVSAVPFQASAEEVTETVAPTAAATEPAVVETEAAVAPVAEVEESEAVEQEINVNAPAVNAEVVDKEVRYVEFQVTIDGKGPYRVGNLVKTKIGSKVNTPSESAVLSVVKSIIGTSDGYALIRWALASTGETFTSATTINLSMEADGDPVYDEKTEEDIPTICVDAIVELVAKNITLKPNGGTIANSKMSVTIGKTYGECGGLPLPTRTGYDFQGWMKADGTMVNNESPVTDLSTLTAQWTLGKPVVTYWNYEGEVAFGPFNVDANSVLKAAYNNFPTEAQVKELFNPDTSTGWYIAGWEYSVDGGETFKTFKEGSTKITTATIIRPLYQKSITLYALDSGSTSRKLTVTLGKPYPALPHPGTREGYAFLGWCLDSNGGEDSMVSSKANLSNVSYHPNVTFDVNALYAWWDNASTLYLYIHTNGNTDEHTKLVRYYDVPLSGLNLKNIDLSEIFPNYGKYDDEGDEKYGWYSNAQWKNYVLGRYVNETTEVFVPDPEQDDIYEFYIMLIDNGNNASSSASNGVGYNDNKTTVDSSNPSTGDDIFVAVTVMAVSACALLLFFMNKKRFAK